MIEIKNLSKSYKISKKLNIEVLKDISVRFNMGELVAIVGESGSGKSTLLNIIGGLDNKYQGSVMVDDNELKDDKKPYNYRKNKIGFVFQSFNLLTHLSVEDNIRISMDISNMKNKSIYDFARKLGIDDILNKKINTLSGGECQRVAIARALIKDPDIILADEPTGSLDSKNSKMIMNILADIAKSGKLVIIVTHSNEVAKRCNRVIKIVDGCIKDISNKKLDNNVQNNKSSKVSNIKRLLPLKMALKNLLQKFKRNLLVSLATSIGLLSIMLVLSLGEGVKTYLKEGIDEIVNPKIIEVYKDDGSSFSDSELNAIKEIDNVEKIDLKLNTMYIYSFDIKKNDFIINNLKDLNYIVLDQQDIINTYLDTIDLITYVLSIVAFISLVVSMIMIAIILYIGVVERTKEIGILRALGLRKQDVKKIFLSESFLIGLLSSSVSIILLFMTSFLINKLLMNYFEVSLVKIKIEYLMLGIVTSIIISTLSSLYPARVASNLNIIESLRRE